MILCKNCYVPMVGVMSFSKDKHEKFCQCPKCRLETKHMPIKDSELNFREILHSEIKKNTKENKDVRRR